MSAGHLSGLARHWRAEAVMLRRYGNEPSAATLEVCAGALEEALSQEGETPLTLEEAAERSGYSADHLGRLVREGKLANAGRRGAPRIALGDLPRRAGLEPRPRHSHLSRTQIVRSAIKKGA